MFSWKLLGELGSIVCIQRDLLLCNFRYVKFLNINELHQNNWKEQST